MERLDDDAIAAALQGLQWDRDGDRLVRVVKRKDFAEAMEFVNGVAQLAEGANHHPDITVSWNTVTLHLTTHSADGITQNDISLAAAIDGLLPA
ncbi:MAG: 4a-hydroxytetrahydrobiopterin dehydratase [Actinomycetota bacterium]|nr:4a-hydroxytetrahydrobiopterin dehydratase [Actinomycetota bacterium]